MKRHILKLFRRQIADKNYTPVTMFEMRLEPGARIGQELPADYNAFLVVLEGEGLLGASGPMANPEVTGGTMGFGYIRGQHHENSSRSSATRNAFVFVLGKRSDGR